MSRMSLYGVWVGGIAAVALFLWGFGGMLMPFVTGLVVAYLLNPVVQKGEAFGWPRRYCALGLVVAAVLVCIAVTAFVVPLLVTEMMSFANALPSIIARVKAEIAPYLPIDMTADSGRFSQVFQSYSASALRSASGVLASTMAVGQAALSFFAFIALMPVVAFFMMKEWPGIVSTMDDLLPRTGAPTIRALVRDIDGRISGFVRGQLIICVILAVYYTIALSIVGLDYAVFVGVVSGLLALIPFVGSFFAVASSVLIGAFQVSTDGWGVLVGAVAAVALGQFVEGNFITPKIVGDRVGLHPLWIIFALMAGAHVMGLLGMVIAVPVAAVVAVLMGFAIARYKSSHMYHGGHLMPPKTNG